MSDVLVKMLRGRCNCNMPSTPCGSEDECRFDFRVADRIEELEAKLAKAVEALRFYAEGEWAEDYPGGVLYAAGDDTLEFKTHLDYGDLARTALAELRGETDE